MVVHNELRPDPGLLPLTVAEKAMRLALTAQTRNAGSLYIPNPNGDDLIFGESAEDGANWVDGDGKQSPLVDTEFFKQGIEQANQEITVINDRIEQMDAEAEQMQAHIDSVRREAQENFQTAKAAADDAAQKADAASQDVADFRTEVNETVQTVKDSVDDVRSDVDAVTRKAADLASELDGTKATVEQVVTEQGEIRTTVSNAVEKADQSLQVSTQASQTATAASQKATSAYEDAQTAINQSSEAVQTANEVSLSLKTDYQTKADADAKYATQASLTATSEQIRTEVSETYATQATVNALENLANNAVQTWMGDGVPTLSNKPASDWTTSELKSQHSGDLYYDTDTGYAYRFGSNDGTNYSWALVKDTDITKALADAAKAQETAEGAQSGVNELKTSIPVTYATKSELSQKADSITARVEEVAQAGQTTSSKVAELELTADGLRTTVKEQASKIDQNATTISQVSQKADSLSSTITQVQGDVADVDAKADTAQATANSAMSQASRVEQSLDSFKTSVSRDYQTKTDAMSQKSELEQNINSFKTTVSETYEAKTHASDTYLDKNTASSTYTSKTEFKQTTDKISATATAASQNASSALSKVSSLEVSVDGIDAKVEENASDIADAVKTTSQVSQRVDSLSSTITQVSNTANSALSKSSSVEQNLNSFKTSVSQTYETKSDALSKQSSLQQSVNNLRTEVSETYATKDEFNALEIGGTNLIRGSANGGSDYSPGNGSMRNDGYLGNGAVHTNRAWYGYYIRMKNIADRGDVKTGDTVTLSIYVSTSSSSEVTNSFGLYRAKPTDYGVIGNVTLKSGRWERLTATFAINDASALTNSARFECTTDTNYDILWSCPQVEIGTKPTDWSPCPADMLSSDQAAQTYSTKSYVDQTARTVSLGVVEEYKNGQHGSALATASDITATKNNITSTVSQTYLSKNDASAQYATKTQVQQTSDSLTVKINQSLDLVNSQIKIQNPSFETGDLTGWSTEGFSNARVTKGSAVGDYRFEGNLTTSSGGYAYLRQSQTFGLIPGHSYRISATRVYLDNTQELMFCIRRMKDNSRLTPYSTTFGGGAWRSISGVTTVPSSYSVDETYRIEIIVNRGTNNRLLVDDVSIEDVTDASAAQSTANTANANATNANNRVGNLETCIKMTSNGVRVGKISNGNFTGYSALVNSAGSFDVLDGSGDAITRFTNYGMEIPSNNNGNRDGKFVLTSSGYDLSFVKDGKTYYFRLGSGGIGIHAPDGSYVNVGSGGIAVHAKDGSYMDLSSGNGLALETKTFGSLRIGSGGLQFTNDQSWGFRMSVTGWSIKWAGNHTLATGDEAGALYIDGRKIQVV